MVFQPYEKGEGSYIKNLSLTLSSEEFDRYIRYSFNMKNLYINDKLIYFIVTTNNPTILIKIHQHLNSYVIIEVMPL